VKLSPETAADLGEQARRLRFSVTRLARLLRAQDGGGLGGQFHAAPQPAKIISYPN